MKKRIFLFVFVFCNSFFAYSQNTFEKIIDTLGAGPASCVQQTFDGGYIVEFPRKVTH